MVGVGGDRCFQVEGVGEVDVTVDLDSAVDTDPCEFDVEAPGLGGREALGLGGLGVEPGLGLLDQPAQLRRSDGMGERGHHGVDERRRLRRQTDRLVGDEPELPRRQLTRHQAGPAAREAVVALDRPGQVAATGVRRLAHRRRELDHGELRDLRTPLTAEWQRRLVPLIHGSDQRLAGVHGRPPRSRLEHLSRAAASSTRLCARAYANTAAGSSHPSSESGSKVEVIVGPTQPPTTDSPSPKAELSTGVAERSFRKFLRRVASARSLRCGGLDTLDPRTGRPRADPANPTRRDRSQTAGGNPIASPPLTPRLSGCRRTRAGAPATKVSLPSLRDLLNRRPSRTPPGSGLGRCPFARPWRRGLVVGRPASPSRRCAA